MEWKIGEIKQVKGEWYQCVESQDGSCKHCDMNFEGKCPMPIKECTESGRSDKSYVIFKKLEKVGEPYMLEDKKFQKYRVFHTPYIYHKIDYSWQSFADPYYVSLEIKQTKKDMEEEKHSNLENTGKNMKPFDLQKAKAGKPVCTRDGRKARIICFDRDWDMQIVALVADPLGESVHYYLSNGKVDFDKQNDEDLMMLPEKKEGWAVISRNDIYETEEKAKEVLLDSRIGVMIRKVEWEE